MFSGEVEAAAWLSGIIDGEGSVSARRVVRQSRTAGFVREVRITNTDVQILGAVRDALDLLGVAHTTYDRSERARLGTKPIFDIVISRRANLERLATRVTLRSEKATRLAEMLGSYTTYGQRPSRDEFERVLRERGQRGAAEHFSVSQGTIYNWRRHFGIEPNPPGRPRS